MKRIKNLYQKLPAPLRNKYLITFVVFLVWIFFIDTFDIITQIRMNNEFKQLKEQQEFYKAEIEKDNLRKSRKKKHYDTIPLTYIAGHDYDR